MKSFITILLLVLVVSCAPIYVNYDYEKTADFSTYKTYNYYSQMDTGLSELDTKRFIDALNLKMQAIGLSISDTPDFYVDIKTNEFHGAQRNNVGLGVGGGGGNVGGGISIGIPIGQSNINRQITLDFVDENKAGLFWQAVSESSYNPNANPDQREKQMKAIVEKVLSKYPPKKK